MDRETFKAGLLASFPEWVSFAHYTDDEEAAFSGVEVPPPAEADAHDGLWVDVEDDEVTVGFDWWHAHFALWPEGPLTEEGEAALALIRYIVAERVAILSWWVDEALQGSITLQTDNPGDRQMPVTRVDFDHTACNRIRIRSWKGTFNENRAVPPSGEK